MMGHRREDLGQACPLPGKRQLAQSELLKKLRDLPKMPFNLRRIMNVEQERVSEESYECIWRMDSANRHLIAMRRPSQEVQTTERHWALPESDTRGAEDHATLAGATSVRCGARRVAGDGFQAIAMQPTPRVAGNNVPTALLLDEQEAVVGKQRIPALRQICCKGRFPVSGRTNKPYGGPVWRDDRRRMDDQTSRLRESQRKHLVNE